MRSTALALIVTVIASCSSVWAAPADEPPQWVPLGVYLSWERTAACARALNIDRWDDVRGRLDVIAANHVDTLWVTNMAEADLPRLIGECEKRSIKLVASMSTVEAKIAWRWANGGIYTLAPEAPAPATENLPVPDVAWKHVLAKKATDLGPNALTNPDCSPTPQLVELGRIYGSIAPHKSLVRRWQPTATPIASVTPPGQIQCFVDPASGRRYALVVNDDLQQSQVIQVRLEGDAGDLVDIINKQKTGTVESSRNENGPATIRLNPGDGTILEIMASGKRGV